MRPGSFQITPDIAIGFALFAVGSVVTLLSRNVRLKRIVFPLTIVVSNAVIYLILRRSGALANLPPAVLIALLTANALFTMRIVRFCENCGRTIGKPMLSTSPARCPSCQAAQTQ